MNSLQYSTRFTLENRPYSAQELLAQIFDARDAGAIWKQAQQQPTSLYQLKNLLSPHGEYGLAGLEAAVTRVLQAIYQKQKILIVGDYDTDGATSTALLIRFFNAIDHCNIDYLVPNRFEFGYGLSPLLVKEALKHQPELIITVDNGISSIDGAALCQEHDVDLIITDHHLPGAKLPSAVAIVNPNQAECPFVSKSLAGVGVAFYFACAIKTKLEEANYFSEQALKVPRMDHFLDLVALGTVADLVPLDDNNRILVSEGLARIRAGIVRPGIRALFSVAGRDTQKACASDFGFMIAPRLNAAGRLDDMSIGIECLICGDEHRATEFAQILHDMNADRRSIESTMTSEAQLQLAAIDQDQLSGRFAICLYHAEWHEGVIGILASRVKEAHFRPCIIFAKDEANNKLKGSARSIPGLHIRDVLANIDSLYPGMLLSFGGHAMAAGLTISCDAFEAFSAAFEDACKQALQGRLPSQVHETDTKLSAELISLELAQLIEASGPWGQRFPEPSFYGRFRVEDARKLGKNTLKLQLRDAKQQRSNQLLEAIKFREADADPAALVGSVIDCIFTLQINRFRGSETLQLLIQTFDMIKDSTVASVA